MSGSVGTATERHGSHGCGEVWINAASNGGVFSFANHITVLFSPYMATRYFKHFGSDPVRLANGRQIAFKSLDGLQSFLGTQDPEIWAGLEECMKQGRSSVSEIPWSEFDAQYLQKKSTSPQLRAPWREELVRGQLMVSDSTLRDRLNAAQAVVGVVNPPPPAPHPSPAPIPAAIAQATVNQQIAAALPKPADYKPQVGKRRKAKVT